MKRMVILLALCSPSVMASTLPPVSKVEEECNKQAVLISQTYAMYRSGFSEARAIAEQSTDHTSKENMAWLKNMVHSVFSDSRSMFVNVDATVFKHELDCNNNPEAYIKDKRVFQ